MHDYYLGEDVGVTRPVEGVAEEVGLRHHANDAGLLYGWGEVGEVVGAHLPIFSEEVCLGVRNAL